MTDKSDWVAPLPGMAMSKRLDERAGQAGRSAFGAQEVEDRICNRIAELQAKDKLTEGERMELHRLLERRWP